MSHIQPSSITVKSCDLRLIVDFSGNLAVVDHGICRRPSGADLALLPRPGRRAFGFRDEEA